MTALLDVNVLVALAWPNHVHHRAAASWFRDQRSEGWATCPAAEAGFVRVSSNTAVLPDARSPAEAVELIRRLRMLPGFEFWSDDVTLCDLPEVRLDRVVGHRQVADAALLGLAVRRGGRLATFDAALTQLARSPSHVEVLAP